MKKIVNTYTNFLTFLKIENVFWIHEHFILFANFFKIMNIFKQFPWIGEHFRINEHFFLEIGGEIIEIQGHFFDFKIFFEMNNHFLNEWTFYEWINYFVRHEQFLNFLDIFSFMNFFLFAKFYLNSLTFLTHRILKNNNEIFWISWTFVLN